MDTYFGGNNLFKCNFENFCVMVKSNFCTLETSNKAALGIFIDSFPLR